MFMLALLLCVGNVAGKKWSKRKMAGNYTFSASNLFNGTLVLAKDKAASKLPATNGAHSIAGKWKFKRGKQRVTIAWPDVSDFLGYVLDRDTITGVYSNVDGDIVPCGLTRTSNNVFHMHITRTRNHHVRGVVLFNYGHKDVRKRDYRVVVYSRMSGETARVAYTTENHSMKTRLSRLGFFHRRLKEYDYAECYLISMLYDPPTESTNFPALTLDYTNVFAYDWQEPGFKWFDWGVTNWY